jgi:hypothetical protein
MRELKTRIKIISRVDGSKSYIPQYKVWFMWFSFSKSVILSYEFWWTPKGCVTKVTNNRDMCMAFLDLRHSSWKIKVANRGNNKTDSITYENYPV